MDKTGQSLPRIASALTALTLVGLLAADDWRAALAATAMTAILFRILIAIVPKAMRRQESFARVVRR